MCDDCARERAAREAAERERDRNAEVVVEQNHLWSERCERAESALAAERAARERAERKCQRALCTGAAAMATTGAAALAAEREAHAETRASLEAAKRDHEGACLLVAKMHHAATGAIQGPIRGVVEDVADVRSRLAAAEERLRGIREWAAGLGWLGSPQDERIESEVLAIINPAFLAGGKP